MSIQIPNQPTDSWSEHVCIRTSYEYQFLDEIRQKLNLGQYNMEAPFFEIDTKTGEYIRHCRLKVRRKSYDGFELSRHLYLGLDMKQQIIEVYFTNCLLTTRSGNLKRDADHNWIYGRVSLLDPKMLTGKALTKMIQKSMHKAGAEGQTDRSGRTISRSLVFSKPLFKRAVEHTTVGPYILTTE